MKDMLQNSWISQLLILVACCLFLPISASAGIIDGNLTNDVEGTNHLSRTISETILAVGTSKISGKVIKPAGAVAANGIIVYAIESSTQDWKADVTDVNGDYSIDNLPSGTYTLFFTPSAAADPGLASEWYDDQPTGDTANEIVLVVGEEVELNVELDSSGSITGRVTDINGDGIVGAKVDAYADVETPDPATGGWLGGTVTAADGSYTLNGLRTDVSFKVEFFETYEEKVRGGLTEWYNNKADMNSADSVTTGTSDVDAKLGDVLDSSFSWLLFLPTIIINITKL